MEANFITAVLMPVALGVIMLGLGLGMTREDFRRVVVMPKPVLVGLVFQMLILPAVCFGIVTGFGLAPALAVGLMVLAASPGGATASLFSHLARGDVALNVTLTAVSSLLSLLTLPLIVNFSLAHFMGAGKVLPLQFDRVSQVFLIVLVPVAIGMSVRARRPRAAAKLERPVRIASAVFLMLVIVGTVAKERAHVLEYFEQVGLAALAFNLVNLAAGFLVPLVARLPRRQAISLGMQLGIYNGPLAMTVAGAPTLLNDTTMAIPPAIYSLIMLVNAGALCLLLGRGSDRGA